MPWVDGDRLRALEDIESRYAAALPFIDIATRVSVQFGHHTDPTIGEATGVDDARAAAEQVVYDEEKHRLVADYARAHRATRRQEIADRVEATEGDALRAAEDARYERDEAPALTAATEQETREDIIAARRKELRTTRPGQIKAELIAAHGDEWRTAEDLRFAAGDAEHEVTGERLRVLRNELTQTIKGERIDVAKAAERKKIELATRLSHIKEKAATSNRISFEDLRVDDVLTIELCERREADQRSGSKKASRTIRISVRDPANGVMMITDDSWQNGSPLERANAIEDGTIVVMSTAVLQPEGEIDPATARAFSRGVGLRIAIGKTEAITAGYEVDKVSYPSEGNQQILLGTSNY
jgi:hypothetical protein